MPARPYDGRVSSERPDGDPDVYRMPPEAFRVAPDGVAPPVAERPVGPCPSAAEARQPRTAAPRPDRPARTGAERRRKGWDIALTIVLLVVLLAVAGGASLLGFVLGLGSDACGADGRICREGLLVVGVWIALTAPWLVAAVAVFIAIVRLVVRRRAFWVPLVGMAFVAGLWWIGAAVVWAAT